MDYDAQKNLKHADVVSIMSTVAVSKASVPKTFLVKCVIAWPCTVFAK